MPDGLRLWWLARLLIVSVVVLPTVGCASVLSSLAARSPEPIPPVPMSALVVGDSLHWVPNALREVRDRRGVLVERRSDALLVRLHRRDTTVALTGAALGSLQVARGKTKSRGRAFWRPTFGALIGSFVGLGAEFAFGGGGFGGPFLGLVAGTIVGIWNGHQPVTRWVPVVP